MLTRSDFSFCSETWTLLVLVGQICEKLAETARSQFFFRGLAQFE